MRLHGRAADLTPTNSDSQIEPENPKGRFQNFLPVIFGKCFSLYEPPTPILKYFLAPNCKIFLTNARLKTPTPVKCDLLTSENPKC